MIINLSLAISLAISFDVSPLIASKQFLILDWLDYSYSET
jgi:hypothetical protein